MSKRQRPPSSDEEERQKTKGRRQQIDNEGTDPANRKIYKIKRDEKPTVSQGSGQIDLKIKDSNDLKGSAFDIKMPQNPFKLNLLNQSQGVGLFSNLSNPAPSIFANKASTQDNDSKQPAKITPPANGGLFSVSSCSSGGNIFTNFTSTSLFTSNTGSLFGSGKPSGILFGGSASTFNATPLFGNKITGPITAPPEKDEDQGDSQELEKDQEMVVDPSKSTVKFDYGGQDDILKKIAVTKFKKDKGNLVESVEAIIKHDSEKKLNYLIIRLATTKNIIFTGILLPHKSSVKRNNENLDILAFALNEKKVLEAHRIKLQIKGLDNELGEFYQEIEKIVEGKSETEKKSE